MFGCAQSSGHGEEVVLASAGSGSDAGTPAASAPANPAPATSGPADGGTPDAAVDAGGSTAGGGATGTADAGPPPGPCNPSIDAAAGTTVADDGACPGILPARPSCAADLILCTGVSSSTTGSLHGTYAAAAEGDGTGGLALACGNSDVGPSRFFSLYLPMPSGFVSKSFLGYAAWSTHDGFITVGTSPAVAAYVFRAQDGSELASVAAGGQIFAGERSIVVVRVAQQGSDALIAAQGYRADGTPLGDVQPVAALAGVRASEIMLGGAAEPSGKTLAIWQVYGQSGAWARWIAADGTALTGAFAIAGWLDHVPDAAALAGGGIALPALPGSGAAWRSVIASGATAEQPAPAWLASRGAFALFPGGRAMLFGAEVLAAGGTLCGTLDLGAPVVGIGRDGTTVTARDQKTFRIYPQLLR